MNIMSPISISNSPSGSFKSGEPAPISSNIESPSLMGAFALLETVQEDVLSEEASKEQASSNSSNSSHIDTDSDSEISEQGEVVAILNASNDGGKTQRSLIAGISPNTEKALTASGNLVSAPQGNINPQISPLATQSSAQTVKTTQDKTLVNGGDQVSVMAIKQTSPEGDMVKVQAPKAINENLALTSPEKQTAKMDSSALELGMVAVKDSNKTVPVSVTSTANNVSINMQNTDVAAIQFAAKVQVDTKQRADSLGQQLNEIIKDKVDIQISAKKQSATIRLDPPELGKLEVKVRVDGDKLFVTVNANHAQTREAINQGLDRLRAELNFNGQVSVDIGNLPNESTDSAEKYLNEGLLSTIKTNKEAEFFDHGEAAENATPELLHSSNAAIARI